MNIEIGTQAAQFPKKEKINGIFDAVHQRERESNKGQREVVGQRGVGEDDS